MNIIQQDWRLIFRDNFTDLQALADFLELTTDQKKLLTARPRFMVNVPKRLAKKMAKGSLEDPIFRQFVPLAEEDILNDTFMSDPVGDATFKCAPKLLHKYQGRALLVCTSACAMHCRYCFRQNFSYETQQKGFAQELALIAADTSLEEIILSGGDPLSLPDHTIAALLEDLSAIPHIKRVRFHSRFPVGIPERINDSFIATLQRFAFSYWFVVHINHPNELDEDVIHALKKILKCGIPVLNQAVLLRGVNDTVAIQQELCSQLVNCGIFPYYLHQLDRVQGAQHFEVSEDIGRTLISELQKVLPGYAVPKYVKEICGEPNKTPLLLK